MILGLIELALIALVLGLLIFGGWTLWRMLEGEAAGPGRLPGRALAELAAAIAQARWLPGHDEVDGTTRVLLRRTYTGLDGRPAILEERGLETLPAHDPGREPRVAEAMSSARFRGAYRT